MSSSSLPMEFPGVGGPASIKSGERRYQSEMMFIGERCHLSQCNREDFLPFRCADCHHQFCSDHYKTTEHHCTHASATFLVPLCPLCHEPPKNWKRNEDPNIAMNLHLSPHPQSGQIECRAVDINGVVRDDAKGKQQPREKRENECQERKCKKLMIVPITCPTCHLQFCPSHRAPVQHACITSKAKTTTTTASSSILKTRLSNVVSSQSKSPSANIDSTKKEKALDTKPNPLQAIGAVHSGLKTDKRARLEHESALKALKARHAKGLLSSADEVRLAQEMALMQEKKNSKQDCVVL